MSTKATRRLLLSAAIAAAAPLALALPFLATPALAQGGLHAGTLEVPLNKSEIVSTDVSIAKAMIGNDDIADVLPINSKSIYVLGKKMGTTSLTLYDASGRVISIMDIAVGPDVESLRTQLGQFVPGEKIDATISNDAVVLSGLVSDPGAVTRAVQIARTYAGDKVVNLMSVGSSQQVMLEVRFAEVNRSSGFDVGMNFAARSATGRFSGITGQGSGFVPATPGTVTITEGPGGTTVTNSGGTPSFLSTVPIAGAFGVFRQQFSLGGLTIDSMLNALETKGLAKTLAQPTLVALSGEKASFLAGGEFPVPVAQSGGVTGVGGQAITVEFKPFGVSLGFTPTVLGDKTISMIVEPEVSSIDPTASITVGNITIPGLRTRRASTTLELRDGESFAIAGLMQQDYKTNVSQLPLLGSLPIIGSLFRSSSFQKGETELLIVVTPRLVAPIKPSQVRLPTDLISDPSAARTILLGDPSATRKLPDAPGTAPLSAAKSAPAQAAQTSELPVAPKETAKEATYAY
jgi:pilus assembly protein CpaC